MEAFVQVLEKYIFILFLLPEICCLGHQLIQKYRCYVIVGEWYCKQILFWTDSDACDPRCSLLGGCPFFNQLQFLLFVPSALFFADPQTEFACTAPKYKAFGEGT